LNEKKERIELIILYTSKSSVFLQNLNHEKNFISFI